jgi:creatinine amidohydrolase
MSTLPKRDWAEMTAQDLAAGVDKTRWIAVLPLAAVEQHGPHLPIEVDVIIAEAYLARTRKIIPAELPVTFLPLQPIGFSQEHVAFPGTRTLSAEAAVRAWTEIGESVHRAGLRKLLLMTSHGGNTAVMDIVARDLRARNAMLVVTCGWHRFGYPEGLFSAEERRHGIHAGEIETSLMLAARPDAVQMEKADNFTPATVTMEKEFRWLHASRPAGFGWMTQDLHPSGAVGNARIATAEKGEAALTHGAKAFVELLREIERFDLKALRAGPAA